jgi:hypothetical protein
MLAVKRLDYQIPMNDYLLLMVEQDVDYVLMLVYKMKYDLIAKNKNNRNVRNENEFTVGEGLFLRC